ncbi:MAG TPA: hypothetical protein VL173_17805 [Vicinamibacterales bacterium]|nr:hypothetical protein [Vicinamibacterales bacterium]
MGWFRAYFLGAIWVLILWLIVGAWRLRRRTVRPGPAILDSMHLLHDDRQRAAIEVIQEERTGDRDPEDKDGDLPQLERPTSP